MLVRAKQQGVILQETYRVNRNTAFAQNALCKALALTVRMHWL